MYSLVRNIPIAAAGSAITECEIQRRCDTHQAQLQTLCPPLSKLTSYHLVRQVRIDKEQLVVDFSLDRVLQRDFWVETADAEREAQRLIQSILQTFSVINRIAVDVDDDFREPVPSDEIALRNLMRDRHGQTLIYDTADGLLALDFPESKLLTSPAAIEICCRAISVSRTHAWITQARCADVGLFARMSAAKQYRLSFPLKQDNLPIARQLLEAAFAKRILNMKARVRYESTTKVVVDFLFDSIVPDL